MDKRSNIIHSLIIFAGLLFLGFSIIYAADTLKLAPKDEDRYQIIQLNEVNIAVIDKQTNKIYYKYISPSEAPTDWQEIVMPK